MRLGFVWKVIGVGLALGVAAWEGLRWIVERDERASAAAPEPRPARVDVYVDGQRVENGDGSVPGATTRRDA